MPQASATQMAVYLTDDTNHSYGFWLEGSKVCGKDNVLETNAWTTIRVFCDFSADTPTVRVYADDAAISNETTNIKNFWRVRFHSEKEFAAGVYCFDNFVIYSGEPVFDDTVYELNYKSAVEADYNEVQGLSVISIYGDYMIDGIKGSAAGLIKCENDEILLSCEKLSAIYDTQINADTYLPYDEALAVFGKSAVYDDRGFIYWNNNGESLTLTDDEKWAVHNLVMYERPTRADLAQNVKKTHPRLSLSKGRISEIKREIMENEYAAWYFNTSKTRIEDYYNAKLLNDASNTNNIMMKARTLLDRVKNLALYYHCMEDSAADAKEYDIKDNIKSKIWENIEAVINDEDFPHWQPDSGLDNAEMAAAVAYAYDWLYDDWNDEQKKAMEEALYKKALVYAEKNYGGQIGSSSSWWINTGNSNQNAV